MFGAALLFPPEKYDGYMIPKRLVSIAIGFFLTYSQTLGCSWDYPIWPKSKLSDTPLFKFILNERDGVGYIDRQGKVVIRPRFEAYGNHGGDFFGGLANVSTKDTRDFYIDAKGTKVVRPCSLSVETFSEGLVKCWFRDQKKNGYVDREGVIVIPPKFDSASRFSDGLAAVKVNGKFGYIDHSGNLAIPAHFAWASDFADGHALVIRKGGCQWIGYGPCEYPANPPYMITENGEYSPGSFRNPAPRCRYSVIDRKGRVLFAGRYIDAKHFAEGLAPVGDGNKWGFVDYSGNVRVPLRYEMGEPFSEGLARVRKDGKYGYIDQRGRMVIAPQFSYAQDFSEGLAVVTLDQSKYFFIDATGKRAISGDFDAASSFVMGLAHVRDAHGYYFVRWSYIDRTGRAVFTYSNQPNEKRSFR